MDWANLPLPSWLGNQFKSDERRFPLPFFLSFPSLGCSVFIDWAAFSYVRALYRHLALIRCGPRRADRRSRVSKMAPDRYF